MELNKKKKKNTCVFHWAKTWNTAEKITVQKETQDKNVTEVPVTNKRQIPSGDWAMSLEAISSVSELTFQEWLL